MTWLMHSFSDFFHILETLFLTTVFYLEMLGLMNMSSTLLKCAIPKNRKFSALYICVLCTLKSQYTKKMYMVNHCFHFYYILILVGHVSECFWVRFFWRMLAFQFITSFPVPSDNYKICRHAICWPLFKKLLFNLLLT